MLDDIKPLLHSRFMLLLAYLVANLSATFRFRMIIDNCKLTDANCFLFQ